MRSCLVSPGPCPFWMNSPAASDPLDRRHRLVIFASSLGTVFEWYDFYIYGTLAVFFGKLFFPPGNETAGFLASLALFGVGYHMVASRPIENKNILVLGWWSKALGSAFALWYVARGPLPGWFALVVFAADVVYLPPFWVILRRIERARRDLGLGS